MTIHKVREDVWEYVRNDKISIQTVNRIHINQKLKTIQFFKK